MSKYSNLPESHRYVGSAAKGEIEFLSGVDEPLPIVFENKYVTIVEDPVMFPSGKQGSYLRIFETGDLAGQRGVVVLPRAQGKFYLVKIFRHATRSWHLELPRGFADPGCTSEENARREIKEELGVSVIDLTKVGSVCPNSGMAVSKVDIILAELEEEPNLEKADLETEAILSYQRFDAEELWTLIQSGGIDDGFTLSALMLASCKELM